MINHRALLTDLYELTMAQSHFNEGRQDEIAYFNYQDRKSVV